MKAFAKRAYFNSTQLGEDIAMFAEEAQVMATQKAKDTISQTQKYVTEQTDQLTKAVDPYTRQMSEFYRANVEQHVRAADAAARPIYNKHVVPVYDKHVAPVVADAQLLQRQSTEQFWKLWDDGFKELVSMAQKRCKTSKKEIDKAPTMIRERMQKVCQDPAVVIGDALLVLTVIIAILLRKPIWKLIWGTIRAVFSVIWYNHIRM